MATCQLHYFSNALQKETTANVILYEGDQPGPYRVMFLLHGLSDNETAWSRQTSIERYVRPLPLIVVMPDGGRSFYIDATEGPAYAQAIGVELPAVIQRYFPVTHDGWSITGLSMGGYGALKIALDRPDLFVSAVSHSGALHFGHGSPPEDADPAFVREFRRVLGDSPQGGVNDLFAKVLSMPLEQLPAMRIDCGVDDFLIEPNREFSRHLTAHGIPHEYEEFPGDHNWSYWDEHVQEAIAFHQRYWR